MLQDFTTRLLAKRQLTHDVWEFRFECISPDTLEFQAGQYMLLKVPTDGTHKLKHYSISSPASQKNIFDLLI